MLRLSIQRERNPIRKLSRLLISPLDVGKQIDRSAGVCIEGDSPVLIISILMFHVFIALGNLLPLFIQSLLSVQFCSARYVTVASYKMVINWMIHA